MKIAIMGTGGLGGYIGGRLAHSGQDVMFIARGKSLQALRERGLHVKSTHGDFQLEKVRATDNCADVGPVDLILFCVKSYSTKSAALQIKPMVKSETAILPVLNGVDHIDILQNELGPAHVLGGVCIMSAHLLEPGHVEQLGPLHQLEFGELSGDITERCMKIQQVLSKTNIDAKTIHNIVERMWGKLAVMTGMFGVYSVVRGNHSVICREPETRNLIFQTVGEAIAVAQAKKIPLNNSLLEEVKAAMDAMPPTFQPSMKIDLERGKRIELEAVNGAISRMGKELGVPTPLNDFIYACLKPYAGGRI